MSNTELLPIEQDTSRISFTIKINSEKLSELINVISVSVHNEVNRIPAAFICIGDGDAATADWPASNEDFFTPGNEIEILAGYHGIDENIFKGIITSHSLKVRQGKRELNVECRDKTILMTIARKSNLFEDVTDSEIATSLLSEYGLDGSIEDSSVTHAAVVQYDSTDWDFMISRIESAGLVTINNKGKTDIVKPVLESTALATIRFGTNVIEFDAEIDGCNQYAAVKAQAWDPAGQELIEAEANDPGWTTPGNFDAADIGTKSGAEEFVLRQAGKLTEEEIQKWADGKLLRSRMAFLCGRARVQGFSKAAPGITIAIEGMGKRMNGMAWISGVRHEISCGNWLTDLQLGLSQKSHLEIFRDQSSQAAGLLPPIHGLHTAVVTALEGDPDSEGRIRIKIPSVSLDGEGLWARFAAPDAGGDRGCVFLPEIDDEVVVGFFDDDPGQPVVLGGLFSGANAAPITASDDNHQKGFTTRSGIHILFDDDKKTITIDTPGGNKLMLDDDQKQINITDQNGNKILLSSDGITLDSAKDVIIKAKGDVKLEGTKGLQLKASAQFKAEGSAGVELTSSAITTIKGSLVQIN